MQIRNPENEQPVVQLLDKSGNLIRMVSQIQSRQLIRAGLCNLVVSQQPIIEFIFDQWNDRLLTKKKESRQYIRKSVLYGNYRFVSPEGVEMFHCDAAKVLWYLCRDKAELIATDPPTFRLKFKPNGSGYHGDEYHLTEKENICVVCGTNQRLNRHHVIPYCFRRFIHAALKAHNCHDILLVCFECHHDYEIEADSLKRQLCKEHGYLMPMNGQIYMPYMGRAKGFARALFNYESQIPEAKKLEMWQHIRTYLGKTDVTRDELYELGNINACVCPVDYESFGKFIVERVDIQAFAIRWRNHFVDTMKPKFLPKLWDTNFILKDYR